MDANSTVTGWAYHDSVIGGYGQLTWTTHVGHGFLACASNETAGAYSIRAFTGFEYLAECEEVTLLTQELSGSGNTTVDAATAWQYT